MEVKIFVIVVLALSQCAIGQQFQKGDVIALKIAIVDDHLAAFFGRVIRNYIKVNPPSVPNENGSNARLSNRRIYQQSR